MYDFFTTEWLFSDPNNLPAPLGTGKPQMYSDLLGYMKNPANLPTGAVAGTVNEAAFWAAVGEMKWNKGSDQLYPINRIVPPPYNTTP